MTATKIAILLQKYVVARELRQLASLQHGRDSEQFKAHNIKCVAALNKYEVARAKL